MILIALFLVVAIGFAIYSFVTHAKTSAPGQPIHVRVWTAMVATFLSLLAALGTWLQGLGTTN